MDKLRLDTQLTKEQLTSLDEKRQKLMESMGGVFWLTNTREIRQRLHEVKRQVQDMIAQTRRYDRVNVKRASVSS